MQHGQKYRIKDLTQPGVYLCERQTFTKDEAREQLISFHSVDWKDNGNDRDLNTVSLSEIMEYGQWELEPVKYDRKGREI